ncbi:MAG: iron ABC transporter permease [Elioraea sp.]|nr:iron ABC transporter permease [Elioraea sp.]MDW8443890.1 iron ABC transporter permease [Acetobacteraceae bacterium]
MPHDLALSCRPALARAAPRRPTGWLVAALLIAVAVASPVAAVAAGALAPAGEAWRHLAGTLLPLFVRNSVILALGVGAIVVVLGTACAWLVTTCGFPGRRLLEVALLLPLAVPGYLLAYVYTDLLDFTGPVQTWLRAAFGWSWGDYWFPEIRSVPGAIVILALANYPYVYLLARAAFLEQSVCLGEVARTLGCNRRAMFFRVALPLARPAIASGAGLALMETLADFGAVKHFAVDTFTTGIYQAWLNMGDRVAALQLAACLMGVIAGLLALERLARGRARFHNTSSKQQPLDLRPLGGGAAAAAIAACALPVLGGFVVPAGVLLRFALTEGDPLLGPTILPFARNSLILAALAAALSVAAAVVLAYALRTAGGMAIRFSVRLAALGYAIPGSVIAVGVLVPFGAVDNALDSWMRSLFGISTGLLLSGTIAALVFAYVVRFLAVALSAVEAGFAKIKPSLEDAARVLGRGPGRTLLQVDLPLLRGSLLAGALLVFVDTMKELPATLIVRPFDFDTLAIRVYNLASDERLAQSSTAALLIVAVGLIPVVILTRAMRRAGH